jgi:hypothetical protein
MDALLSAADTNLGRLDGTVGFVVSRLGCSFAKASQLVALASQNYHNAKKPIYTTRTQGSGRLIFFQDEPVDAVFQWKSLTFDNL